MTKKDNSKSTITFNLNSTDNALSKEEFTKILKEKVVANNNNKNKR